MKILTEKLECKQITVKNTFYYGEFEFGGKIYKGRHEPLITKALFDKVQKQLIVSEKEWQKKFPI